jgi:hypothetical protein
VNKIYAHFLDDAPRSAKAALDRALEPVEDRTETGSE